MKRALLHLPTALVARCSVALFCGFIAIAISGCESGVQHMGTTEYGVRFRKLPTFLGGGVGSPSSVASPLESVIVMPWENIYRFDTSPQYLSWGRDMGDPGPGAQLVQNEDVHTRARDGNEAALKLTVRYRLKPDPESLVKLVQEVATNGDQVRELVVAVVRSDIRTFMNRLRTAEFRDDKKRNDTVDETLAAVRSRLEPLGIEVESIVLKQYRFVRLLADGKEVTTYQDRLREIQELEQDIEGERSRVETIRAKKLKELSEAQSKYNVILAEANGFKSQSMYEGDGYFAARSNEALAIKAEGEAEIEGLRRQIAALSGKGGLAILRLEVAKQLASGNPRFVALTDRSKNGPEVGVSRTDMNQLLEQLGLAEAVGGKTAPNAARANGVQSNDIAQPSVEAPANPKN